jgi:hypothetical protein
MSRLFRVFLAAVFLASPVSLQAQQRDGRVAVETPGLALVKPQPWSKDSQATVVKFISFTDRSARGTPGAGYYVLRLSQDRETQVKASQVVKIIIEPTLPQDIRTTEERGMIDKKKADILASAKAVPSALSAVKALCQPLDDALARFDNGEVRVAGEWQSLADFRRQETTKLETRLRQDMSVAKSKRQFDLETNPYFLKLNEFAESDASLKARLGALRGLYQKFVSREEQEEILEKLQNPALPRSDAADLLARLKSLPDPALRTGNVLKLAELADRIIEKVEALKSSFETLFSHPAPPPEVTLIPEKMDAELQVAARLLGEFRAGSPPVGLWVPSAACNACAALRDNLPAVKTSFSARDYGAAVSALSPLCSQSAQIGPQTSEAMGALESYAAETLNVFKSLREKGEGFARGGNKVEAIAALTEALTVMPDESLAQQIEELKKK